MAILLMAGIGQHVHAAGPLAWPGEAIAAKLGCPGDDGDRTVPVEAHCAACHLVRATMPEAPTLHEPVVLQIAGMRQKPDLRRDLAVPDGPARPPRRLRAP